jgi:hypothetical protein
MAEGASPRDKMAGPAYWLKAGRAITSSAQALRKINGILLFNL